MNMQQVLGLKINLPPFRKKVALFPTVFGKVGVINPRVSVEVEWELSRVQVHGWATLCNFFNAEQDGSLRGGVEYVQSAPLPINYVRDLLVYMVNSKVDNANIASDAGARESTHVHIDVTKLEWHQLQDFVTSLLVCEHVLHSLVPQQERVKENLFALNVDETYMHPGLAAVISTPYNKFRNRIQQTRGGKYASFSTNRLADLGTIEWRTFGGMRTLADAAAMYSCLRILRNLWRYSAAVDEFDLDAYLFGISTGDSHLPKILGSPLKDRWNTAAAADAAARVADWVYLLNKSQDYRALAPQRLRGVAAAVEGIDDEEDE